MSRYLIATNVLENIVRGSLAELQGLRVRSALPLVRTKPIEVAVEGEEARVSVHLDARMGEHLPTLARVVRERVAQGLSHMTGLRVTTVDVIVDGVFTTGA